MTEQIKPKPPILNCHTHIFTSKHVPPYLAKGYLPWPFYTLLYLPAIVAIFRWWYNGPGTIQFGRKYKILIKAISDIRSLIAKLGYFLYLPGLFISLHVFYILYNWLKAVTGKGDGEWMKWIEGLEKWLKEHHALYHIPGWWLQLLLVLVSFAFIPSLKNCCFFIFKNMFKVLKMLPGKNTKELIGRYLNIGRYAFHLHQRDTYSDLNSQYPEGTGFLILPMDMEFMGAGKVQENYYQQMDDLQKLKEKNEKTFFPFVFIDPRRISEEKKDGKIINERKFFAEKRKCNGLPFLEYIITEGKTVLKDCVVKKIIEKDEQQRFSGFKIYPALGYYVFDPRLLPLWKYAADNGIPLLTHCIRGTIFYRSGKKDEWNEHPIFKQAMGKEKKDNAVTYEPLVLPERKNVDFSVNFTHPMNYLCLLEESFLRQVVAKYAGDYPELKTLFGYTNETTKLKYNLDHLKICFGHFGGEDEFARYFEQDRYPLSNQVTKDVFFGIDFLETKDGKPSPGKPEQLWNFTDWYSIICSLMLQHPNVYADISYILHDSTACLPLLRETLQHPELKKKLLFGTDFFVVRNHKSDKNLLADMYRGLSEEEFDLIARANPRVFLNLQ